MDNPNFTIQNINNNRRILHFLSNISLVSFDGNELSYTTSNYPPSSSAIDTLSTLSLTEFIIPPNPIPPANIEFLLLGAASGTGGASGPTVYQYSIGTGGTGFIGLTGHGFTGASGTGMTGGVGWYPLSIGLNIGYDAAYNSSQIVAVGRGIGSYFSSSSTNGVTNNWITGTGSSQILTTSYGIIWSAEMEIFVAGGTDTGTGDNRNCIATSVDGVNWTASLTNPFYLASQTNSACNGVCWSPVLRLFIATGQNKPTEDSTLSTAISRDGKTWTVPTNDPFGGGAGHVGKRCCWSTFLHRLVAVGRSHHGGHCIARSQDGLVWTAVNSSFDGGFGLDVCWSDNFGIFVAVGYSTNGRGIILWSVDGIDWTLGTSQPFEQDNSQVTSVCWNSETNYFMVTGSINGAMRTMVCQDPSYFNPFPQWVTVSNGALQSGNRVVSFAPQF